MGEARRRKLLEVHFKAVAHEGQGVHSLIVWTADQAVEALLHAVVADKVPKEIDFLARVLADYEAKSGTAQSALCFCCGGPVLPMAAIVTVAPHIDRPTKIIGGVICFACFGTEQEMRNRVLAAWQQIDPSTRPIDVHPTSGRS